MPAPPLLRSFGVGRRYGSRFAVRDLDLRIETGDIYGLIGRNGAGKTTTLRLITGLLRPSEGRVEISGLPVRLGSCAHRALLGAMIEAPAFYGRLSGRDNLLRLGSLSSTVTPKDADELLALVGLEAAARRPARAYSFGMKQRLGIALALVNHPRLVILDEPTNGLDPQGIRDIRLLIQRLNRELGITFLISSHLLAELELVANRFGILHDGRIAAEGSLAELHARNLRLVVEVPRAAETDAINTLKEVAPQARWAPESEGRSDARIIGHGTRDEIPALTRALVRDGVDLLGIAEERPDLETLFLHLTEGTDS